MSYHEVVTRPSYEIRLYAHRGSSASLPENTMAAFHQALADGANALELDIHRTRDEQFVVCHDPDGRRMAHEDQRIRDSTLAEVKRWDAGRGFCAIDGSTPHAGQGHSIPTLDEVLEAFPGVPISVDLKPPAVDAVPQLLAVVARHDAESRVTLGSFHARVVHRIRSLGYPGCTILTRAEVSALRTLPIGVLRRFIRGQAAQIPVRTAAIRLDGPGLIARCRALGLRLDYWVVNHPGRARELLDRGATGIMTDDPARIAPVVQSLEERTASR